MGDLSTSADPATDTVAVDARAGDDGRGWRYRVGLVILVLSLILPVLALIFLPLFGFPKNVNAVVFGLSLAGGPDVLMIAAAAIMGKENMERILGKIGTWFRRVLRWDTVTRRRYTIGLWVLTIAFLLPYAIALFFEDSVVRADGDPGWAYYVMIGCSIAFVVSFLSMGAPLWQRIRAIYAWDAEISIPPNDQGGD